MADTKELRSSINLRAFIGERGGSVGNEGVLRRDVLFLLSIYFDPVMEYTISLPRAMEVNETSVAIERAVNGVKSQGSTDISTGERAFLWTNPLIPSGCNSGVGRGLTTTAYESVHCGHYHTISLKISSSDNLWARHHRPRGAKSFSQSLQAFPEFLPNTSPMTAPTFTWNRQLAVAVRNNLYRSIPPTNKTSVPASPSYPESHQM